jgi:hypothetical protein
MLMTACLTAIFVNEISADEKSGKPANETQDLENLPGVILDESVGDWVVDRFAGNSTAGNRFYQGPALEVGGLQRAGGVVEGGDGTIYLTSAISGARVPRLMQITSDGVLRVVMEKRGIIEGPMGECRAGSPVWNPKEKALYVTGPNCMRKVVKKPDGSLWVEVAFGVPNKGPGRKEKSKDGPAKEATFPDQGRGVVCNSKGTFYWLQDHVLRRIKDGIVTTIPLKRADGCKKIFNMIYGGTGLCLGENDDTLYIGDYYNNVAGWGMLRCDVKTGILTRVAGIPKGKDIYNRRKVKISGGPPVTDGPAVTHATYIGRGKYHAFYNALWLGGADNCRIRWLRLDGDGWVRTPLPLNVRSNWKRFNIDGPGIPGEQFGFGRCSIVGISGIDSKGGVYISVAHEYHGIWRAYNKKLGGNPFFKKEMEK